MRKASKLIIFVCLLLLIITAVHAFALEERINTKQSFDSLVAQEKNKLSLDNVIIHTRFDFESDAYALRSGNEYYIVLGKENTVSAVRHEMYHIYSMQRKNENNFMEEQLAGVYELTGVAF